MFSHVCGSSQRSQHAAGVRQHRGRGGAGPHVDMALDPLPCKGCAGRVPVDCAWTSIVEQHQHGRQRRAHAHQPTYNHVRAAEELGAALTGPEVEGQVVRVLVLRGEVLTNCTQQLLESFQLQLSVPAVARANVGPNSAILSVSTGSRKGCVKSNAHLATTPDAAHPFWTLFGTPAGLQPMYHLEPPGLLPRYPFFAKKPSSPKVTFDRTGRASRY